MLLYIKYFVLVDFFTYAFQHEKAET